LTVLTGVKIYYFDVPVFR